MGGWTNVIIMQGTIVIKSGQFDRALKMARELVLATRGEDGCITYQFYRGWAEHDPDLLSLPSRRTAALMTHLSSPQVEAFLRQLPEISDGGITTRRYLVQEVEDSEAVVVVDQPPIIH